MDVVSGVGCLSPKLRACRDVHLRSANLVDHVKGYRDLSHVYVFRKCAEDIH